MEFSITYTEQEAFRKEVRDRMEANPPNTRIMSAASSP